MAQLWVWIDQDLCTGDGLCTDHCPEVFRLLDDGISYVVGPDGVAHHTPGGAAQPAPVPTRHDAAVLAAATDCPGECIFIEEHVSGGAAAGWSRGADGGLSGGDGTEDPSDAPRGEHGPVGPWPRSVRVVRHRGDGTTLVLVDGEPVSRG